MYFLSRFYFHIWLSCVYNNDDFPCVFEYIYIFLTIIVIDAEFNVSDS